MSEYVRYKGKIKPLGNVLDLEDFAEKCLRECLSEERYSKLENYYNTKVEFLADECYKSFLISHGVLYEILEKKDLSCEYDMFEATELSDGTVEYQVMYYNGGCGFSEAIEEALNRLR